MAIPGCPLANHDPNSPVQVDTMSIL